MSSHLPETDRKRLPWKQPHMYIGSKAPCLRTPTLFGAKGCIDDCIALLYASSWTPHLSLFLKPWMMSSATLLQSRFFLAMAEISSMKIWIYIICTHLHYMYPKVVALFRRHRAPSSHTKVTNPPPSHLYI
jgi:hypothetical protein